jgi:hypothetical protein
MSMNDAFAEVDRRAMSQRSRQHESNLPTAFRLSLVTFRECACRFHPMRHKARGSGAAPIEPRGSIEMFWISGGLAAASGGLERDRHR